MENKLFILETTNDKNELEYFYFKWDDSKLTIEEVSNKIKEHIIACQENNIEYNHVLAIRKLESLGLQQISAMILTI